MHKLLTRVPKTTFESLPVTEHGIDTTLNKYVDRVAALMQDPVHDSGEQIRNIVSFSVESGLKYAEDAPAPEVENLEEALAKACERRKFITGLETVGCAVAVGPVATSQAIARWHADIRFSFDKERNQHEVIQDKEPQSIIARYGLGTRRIQGLFRWPTTSLQTIERIDLEEGVEKGTDLDFLVKVDRAVRLMNRATGCMVDTDGKFITWPWAQDPPGNYEIVDTPKDCLVTFPAGVIHQTPFEEYDNQDRILAKFY